MKAEWLQQDLNPHHFVHKRTLNNLAKIAYLLLFKWLSCVVSTYLYAAFVCVFLSFQIHYLEWVYTLQLPECQETLCSKEEWYLKVKWLQQDIWKLSDCNRIQSHNHLVCKYTLDHLAKHLTK